jgi:hypothetical protein
MYHNYTNEILFPNQNFGLYVMQSLTLNLQKKDAASRRSVSTRMTLATHSQYYTIDTALEEPVYASMQVLTKWDLPVGFNLSIRSGANPHLIIQGALGNKL